jgi:uncharacterized membrane protein YgcG
MRLRSLLAAALLSIVALTGCNPPEHHKAHSDTSTVHVRQVRNSSDDSLLYWYIIYSSMNNTCPCYTASSPTPVSSMSSLNFTRSTEIPATAGNSASTKVETEQTEEASNEALPEEVQAEVAQDEAAAEAAEAGADSTDGIGDGPNDTSMSDSGGDSGGGDSGGGDSGGGDSGGGGGE